MMGIVDNNFINTSLLWSLMLVKDQEEMTVGTWLGGNIRQFASENESRYCLISIAIAILMKKHLLHDSKEECTAISRYKIQPANMLIELIERCFLWECQSKNAVNFDFS